MLILLNRSVTYISIPRFKDSKLTGHIPKHHIIMYLKGYIYWVIYCGYIPMGCNFKNFNSLHKLQFLVESLNANYSAYIRLFEN